MKNRLPIPDAPLPPVPVAIQKIVCTPLDSIVVSRTKTPSAVLIPGYALAANSASKSARWFHWPGEPTVVPSTNTFTTPPFGGSAWFGPVASTQPTLANADPLTVAPCAGRSIAPNGALDPALLHVIVLLPSAVEWPSASKAKVRRVNVPLPRPGRKLVSSR